MKGARDLHLVDAALERARAQSALMLERMRRRRRKKRKLVTSAPREEFERKRSKLSRAIERMKGERLLRAWRRDRDAENNCANLAGAELMRIDAASNVVEAKGDRLKKDVRTRELTAGALRTAATLFERRDLVRKAEKLEAAGKQGQWGVRKDDGSVVVRLLERSGLIMLDPAESRERTAELVERLLPVLLECGKRKFEIHKAVFSEPNIPAGNLKWGKKHIYEGFMRRILERDASGQEIPRTIKTRAGGRLLEIPNPARRFPEIVGAFAVQEDPLARNCHHWNTHLNVILIVDPGLSAPLERERWPADPDHPGELKRDPAADVPGMFSYMKLSHFWGCQVEIRRLEASLSSLRDQLLEVIKYSCKTVTEKSLEKFENSPPAPGASPTPQEPHQAAPVVELELFEAEGDIAAKRARAPAMIDWPAARVIEWIDANKGFRRVRGWGCLYKLPKLLRPTDPEDAIQWYGRLWISTQRVTVQRDFLSPVDLIRENISRRHAVPLYPQNPARAGPLLN